MARYQLPEDPRKTSKQQQRRSRKRPTDGAATQPIPWFWLGMGGVVTLVAVVAAVLLARSILLRPPLPTDNAQAPMIIRLTAPPSPTPSATPPFPTPTIIPTFTPVPTPDLARPPDEVTVGYYAAVQGTGGFGVTVRGGPSTSNAPITVAPEGTLLFVIGGPQADTAVERLWWQVRLADGQEGWVAGEFLAPAAAP